MTRNPGIVLILTALVLTLSLACAGEMPTQTPAPAPIPTAVTPPTETAALEPTEAPTEMAVAVTSPVVTPSPAQGRAAGGAVPAGAGTETGSEAVIIPIASGSSWRPMDVVVGVHRGVPSAREQARAPSEGLTVAATGKVTFPADEAYVVVIPARYFGPSGPTQMTERDRKQIRESVVALGLSEDSVSFDQTARYSSTSVLVRVPLEELSALEEPVLDAIEEVVREQEGKGVLYKLSDENCAAALSGARREAIPAAESSAEDLANALGVSIGGVIAALEYPVAPGYGFEGSDDHLCGAGTNYPLLKASGSPAEVEVLVGVQVTYSLR